MPSKGVQWLHIHYGRSAGVTIHTEISTAKKNGIHGTCCVNLIIINQLIMKRDNFFGSDLLDWLAFWRFQTFTVQSSEPVTRTGSDGWKATEVTASK